MFALFAPLFVFASLVPIMSAAPSSHATTVTTLGDGTSYKTGSIEGMSWQASGVMTHGCTNTVASISDCFALTLSSDPNANLDPGNWTARQRNELHFPPQADGSTWDYQWKHYLASGVGSTSHFFHLMQVFSTAADGPVVTLDAKQGNAEIDDVVRGCGPCGSTIPLTTYEGRTTLHSMVVTSGNNGRLRYSVTDAVTGASLLSYSVNGAMGSGTYIKFGTYRATQDITTGVTAYVGDFSSTQQ